MSNENTSLSRDQVRTVIEALLTDFGTGISNVDVHKMVASKLYRVPYESISKDQRMLAKLSLFSFISPDKEELVNEAHNAWEEFHKQFPTLTKLVKE